MAVLLALWAVPGKAQSSGVPGVEVYEHMRLQHRTAAHKTPDALVLIAAEFDDRLPIHLLIYNHGLTNDVREAARIWRLREQMTHAPANTVVVLPEWAARPQEFSIKAGRFHEPGFFAAMLKEIMSKTPGLRNMTFADIETIGVITYSGGNSAAVTEIERNGLGSKITNVTLYDSLYKPYAFDSWLKRNIRQLASNQKQFHNFFFDTRKNSLDQLRRVKQMRASAGIKDASMVSDLNQSRTVLDAKTIAANGIVFKYSSLRNLRNIAHMSVPFTYFPKSLQALKHRRQVLAGSPEDKTL